MIEIGIIGIHNGIYTLSKVPFFSGRLLPEHVDLGLRLTVGEDVLQKPLFESTRGDGKFPDALANKSGRLSSNGEGQENPYFPSLTAGGPGGLPGESMQLKLTGS